MKIIITESRRTQIAIKWLNNNFGDLELYETDREPNYIFYMKNGEVIFDYDKLNGRAYINYRKIWSFFESIFSMDYRLIQSTITKWLNEYYELEVSPTKVGFAEKYKWWWLTTN